MTEPLIDIRNLEIAYGGGHMRAVRGVSFTLGQEKLGIVGESGSGKSTVGRAIMKLLPPTAMVSAERMAFRDIDLIKADERTMMMIRGRRIGLILQDPKYSLNPVMRIGEQIAETYRFHHPKVSAKKTYGQALDMLEAVQIRDPERVARLYPHEISGGMGQRVMIAMMLIAEPEVLIADEPTSALDVTVRLEILALLDELVSRRNLGLIFISHDLNLIRNFCDRVLIMYAGRVVEVLEARDLDKAKHPYTQGLLASLPRIEDPPARLPILKRDPAWLNDLTAETPR
ncbi:MULTISPECIES: ABC transporter ATP-binding protein [Rhizobium]|uniref:Dipeptide ABC transporter ATP-binding protein n=1 Tax=Rhizobium phaseoli TaxID=396 RepID=A0ABM6CK19_9HYPH|nr:ABC transporter ATP-binding protein [Rhizobium phaseoli]KEC70187.1 dipeptide ABC transporter ATP-binding protein [Rhizobium leguminosarum bv. phaseoli CCGM1]ANL56914.1 dipeptide ABC transporter ATP-binding protein [Rhizobium phaseoli]ANL88688.1 dipeptide ABC transporter ATP-binding protein [Rhizobium phaseoli]ANL95197.1 dipeptide ABC transporter ATP-binding protein [Rhizobium phaseoli]PWI51292.1 ABC transporter ATP-binding protein [Rhizobium phaseoli]